MQETQRQLEVAKIRLQDENSSLRQRIRKLEVDYDKAEANREVSEIAESDYFRDLQQRALTMRNKFKASSN